MQDDCKNAWGCAVYNTSASVIPILEGIPLFSSDRSCISYQVSNDNINSLINNPYMPDRTQWLSNIAYSIWNVKEMSDGIVWKRIRSRLNEQGEFSKKRAMNLGLI